MPSQNHIKSRSCAKKAIRSSDIFGSQVQLRYNNEIVFKSMFGGVFSILLAIGIFIYFVIEVSAVLAKTNYTITNSLYKRNLSQDLRSLTLNSDNFLIGLLLEYQGDDSLLSGRVLDQFISISFQKGYFKWDFSNPLQQYQVIYDELSVEMCSASQFGIDKGDSTQNISTYSCIKSGFNIELYGSFSSSSAKFFNIKLQYCNQTKLNLNYPGKNLQCASVNETNKIIPYIQVNMPLVTQYFDSTEFDPTLIIKNATKPFFFKLNEQGAISYNFKVSENFLVLRDSVISNYHDVKNISYTDVKIDYDRLGSLQNSQSSIFEVMMFIDESIQTTERAITTLSSALSAVGGMLGFIQPILRSFLFSLQQTLFTNHLLKRIFLVNKNEIENKSNSKGKKDSSKLNNSKNSKKSNSKNNSKLKPSEKGKNKKNKSLVTEQVFGFSNQMKNSEEDQEAIDLNNFDSHSFLQYFKQLVQFRISVKELVMYRFRQILKSLCKKQPNNKIALFGKGMEELEKNLDIVEFIKKIRKFEIVSQLLLSKHQLALLAMTNDNVLDNDFQSGMNKKNEMTDEKIMKNISKILMSKGDSKVNKRLLKRLQIKTDQAFESQRDHQQQPYSRKNVTRKNNPEQQPNIQPEDII